MRYPWKGLSALGASAVLLVYACSSPGSQEAPPEEEIQSPARTTAAPAPGDDANTDASDRMIGSPGAILDASVDGEASADASLDADASTEPFFWEFTLQDNNGCNSCEHPCRAQCDATRVGERKKCRIAGTQNNDLVYTCTKR
jgi:hypothetical protein